MQQQQQAHAAAVAAAQAQQHSISGQPQQAPLTPGGFYSPATPVQQAQNQQRPPMVSVFERVSSVQPQLPFSGVCDAATKSADVCWTATAASTSSR